MRLSDGEEFASDTLVWTAGVKPNPMLAATDLPLDERGRVECEATLQVRGMPDALGAGDLAAVPDLTTDEPGVPPRPNAQHAVRQARRLADNIVAVLARRASRCPTGTSTSARWPASACTRAWPRSTA